MNLWTSYFFLFTLGTELNVLCSVPKAMSLVAPVRVSEGQSCKLRLLPKLLE